MGHPEIGSGIEPNLVFYRDYGNFDLGPAYQARYLNRRSCGFRIWHERFVGATYASLNGIPCLNPIAWFWANALLQVKPAISPATIKIRVNTGEYRIFILCLSCFVNCPILSSLLEGVFEN
jgi:hypothetical protein